MRIVSRSPLSAIIETMVMKGADNFNNFVPLTQKQTNNSFRHGRSAELTVREARLECNYLRVGVLVPHFGAPNAIAPLASPVAVRHPILQLNKANWALECARSPLAAAAETNKRTERRRHSLRIQICVIYVCFVW